MHFNELYTVKNSCNFYSMSKTVLCNSQTKSCISTRELVFHNINFEHKWIKTDQNGFKRSLCHSFIIFIINNNHNFFFLLLANCCEIGEVKHFWDLLLLENNQFGVLIVIPLHTNLLLIINSMLCFTPNL